MLALLLSALLAGGTYQVEGEAESAVIRSNGSKRTECLRLAPAVSLAVEGAASAQLRVWVDLPKKPKRPKPVKLQVSLDGELEPHTLKPKRGKRLKYVEGRERPSKPLRPITIAVPAGGHELVIRLPGRRTGCLEISGMELAPPEPPAPAVAAAVAPPPLEPPAVEATAVASAEPVTATSPATPAEPDAAPAAEIDPALEGAPTLELPASTGSGGEADPALAMPPPTPAGDSSSGELATDAAADDTASGQEEIRAFGVSETVSDEEPAAAASGAPLVRDLLRIGPKVGGVLPRGDLQPTFFVGAEVELSLGALGVPLAFAIGEMSTDVTLFVSGGWNPMQQQDEVTIQGRGRTQLTQYSLVFPVDVGARFALDLGFDLVVFVGAGLAIDFSSTELQAFSTPPTQEGAITVGFAGGAGVLWRLGPGALSAEIRYREIETNLGDLATAGEAIMANAALHLGYLFIIPN